MNHRQLRVMNIDDCSNRAPKKHRPTTLPVLCLRSSVGAIRSCSDAAYPLVGAIACVARAPSGHVPPLQRRSKIASS
jgi:hypothetical protein